MEDKLKEIASQKLGAYECSPPDVCWDHVSSRISVQAKGWAAQTKWLLATGATIAAASIGVLLFVQGKNEPLTRTEGSEQQQVDQTVPQEGIDSSGEELNTPLKEVQENARVGTSSSLAATSLVLSESDRSSEQVLDVPIQQSPANYATRSGVDEEPTSEMNVTVDSPEETVQAQSAELALSIMNATELLYFFIPSETEASEYRWDFGDGNTSNEMSPEHRYEVPGTYEVRLEVRSNGIAKSAQKRVECYPSPKLVVPTIFTPNGDGKNDYFNPTELSTYVRVTSIQISDATGMLIYRAMGDIPWDGRTTGGYDAPEGNYLFEIKGEDLRQQIVEKRGYVFLQR
jgi:gliding motility-associated-like protein